MWDAADNKPPAPRAAATRGPEVGPRAIRVLLVEDDQDLALALLERLRRRGFAADAVFDGEGALNRIAHFEYHVMVVDLMLPGADGLRVIRRARAMSPGMRAGVLTGQPTDSWRAQSQVVGVDFFLEKPTDIETLCGAIRAAARHGWETLEDGSGT